MMPRMMYDTHARCMGGFWGIGLGVLYLVGKLEIDTDMNRISLDRYELSSISLDS
jgi:hypothetical protein